MAENPFPLHTFETQNIPARPAPAPPVPAPAPSIVRAAVPLNEGGCSTSQCSASKPSLPSFLADSIKGFPVLAWVILSVVLYLQNVLGNQVFVLNSKVDLLLQAALGRTAHIVDENR